MYQPAHFRVDDAAAHRALIAAHPLATLVVPTARGLQVNHLPLRLDDVTGRLIGHVARANPLWTLEPAGEAVAVFRGAEAYVTPGWYASKAEHGRVVPTWNYAVVHVHGRLRWFGADTPEDDARRHAVVAALTEANEAAHAEALRAAGRQPPRAWSVDDAPADWLAGMRRAIVAFELEPTRIEGKFKLSQNRPAADREGVVAGLAERGDAASAALTARPPETR